MGIGLKTGSGVLYGYARSKGDKILTEDEGATESVRYAVDIITKNADVIEIKINQSTVYADLEDVDNAVKAHEAYSQMLPYNPTRTYKQNETCTTYNATTGELETWLSYAPSDNIGHNPQDSTNRHEQWSNFPTPCWWIKHHAVEPGTPVYWFSDDIPENALQIMDTDIDAGFYHRIAKAYPSLVADGKINLADILERYVRVADGVDYLVNTTHEDAIRNITGNFGNIMWPGGQIGGLSNGVFSNVDYAGTPFFATGQNGTGNDGFNFDASNVVPTASQNQPKSTVLNLIIFI